MIQRSSSQSTFDDDEFMPKELELFANFMKKLKMNFCICRKILMKSNFGHVCCGDDFAKITLLYIDIKDIQEKIDGMIEELGGLLSSESYDEDETKRILYILKKKQGLIFTGLNFKGLKFKKVYLMQKCWSLFDEILFEIEDFECEVCFYINGTLKTPKERAEDYIKKLPFSDTDLRKFRRRAVSEKRKPLKNDRKSKTVRKPIRYLN